MAVEIAPLIVPARDRTEYPHTRVSALSVTQRTVGGPLVISYQIERYAVIAGVPVDAPTGTGVGGNLQVGLASLASNKALAAALVAVNEFAVVKAIEAGLLTGVK